MMKLKSLRLKLKGITLKRFLIKYGSRRSSSGKTEKGKTKRAKWLNHVSHGYQVVHSSAEQNGHENSVSARGGPFDDSVVVQREQSQECEVWFFGVFDHRHGLGAAVTKYMQSHFFRKLPPQSLIEKQSKEAIKRAHQSARSNLRDRNAAEETAATRTSSALAMVINGEKLVMANMGEYRAVVCRDGEAFQIGMMKLWPKTQHWSLKYISGVLAVSKGGHKLRGQSKSSDLIVGSEKIDSETEFVILASDGVWEVMKQQEAVNLIRHIEDPQAAAECLATEASTRMARATISCLVIRFD